jgi:squalene-associated FAD-dependent desaturase
MSARVVVIGGGLAGITAAIALASSGAQVTLLEARPRLGGATCSFSRDGLVVDTGQHIFLGCCSAYRGLLGRLGMTGHAPVQDRFDVRVLAPGRAPARLRRTALPGPLHMLPALGRYPFLSWAERAAVSRPALAMRRLDPADPALDAQRFGDWLAARGQSERARRVLWDLFTVSALNVAGDDASLALAATVVKTGLLGKNNAADIGVPALPLGELHGDAAAALLARLGARVALSTKVTAIEVRPSQAGAGAGPSQARATQAGPAEARQGQDARFRIRLAHHDPELPAEIEADAVVLAVPHEKAAPLVPPDALPPGTVAAWSGLGASPIVNVHVIYDRPVTDLPFAAAIDSPVQWVFDRTSISGLGRSHDGSAPDRSDDAPGPGRSHDGSAPDRSHGGPQYLAISLSAADEYAEVPAARLREQFVPALAELFPGARDAQVTEFFVTRELRATFRQVPGSGALRPKTATRLPGLVLAGAWTDTGWPDTMEGAVRSGLSAAIELRPTLGLPSQSRGPARTAEPTWAAVPAASSDPNASASTPNASASTPNASASTPNASASTPNASASTPNASASTIGVRQ